MTSKYDRIRETPRPSRQAALAMLDDLTAPVSPRTIDRALQDEGLTRSEARKLTKVLKRFHVIALTPR
jgi:hypothetical protein